MSLPILWFVVLAVLWCGFLFLEGFDFGVGMLHDFVGTNDVERRVAINTIGPVWDGNEVWLIVAGAGMFAAFPDWYATMFSGFYVALVLLLVALIIRGVSFEFRAQLDNAGWHWLWDARRSPRQLPHPAARRGRPRQPPARRADRRTATSTPARSSRCSTRTRCSSA